MAANPTPFPAHPPDRTRQVLSSLIGLAVSLLFIGLAFRSVDLATLAQRASGLPLAPILWCAATQVACQLLRLLRWGVMVRSLGEISWRKVASIGSVGVAAVSLLPARIGELARPVLVAEGTAIGFGLAASTVVAERLIDGLLMGAVIVATAAAMGERSAGVNLTSSGVTFAATFAVAGLAMALAWRHRTAVAGVIEEAGGRISSSLAKRAGGLFLALVGGVAQLANRRVLLPYAILSVLLWCVEALSIGLLFAVLPSPLGLLAPLVVLSALVVGVAIPSGPAHLGVFEFAVVFGLGLFGVDAGWSSLIGALLHAVQILVLVGFGLFGLMSGGISLERLGRIGR